MTAERTMSPIEELRDEIEMAEARLMYFCNLVHAGQAQGGGREFARQIDAQFRSIKTAFAAVQTSNLQENG